MIELFIEYIVMIWLTILHFSLLAFIQGVTEFLPISSSGHLIFFDFFFKQENEFNLLWLTLVTHLATLFATFIFFRNDLLDLIKGFWGELFFPKQKSKKYLSFFLKILLSLLPTILVGLFAKDFFKTTLFNNFFLVGICFLVTAVILYLPVLFKNKIIESTSSDLLFISYRVAFLIGLSQMVAILPGISRSGTTISIALLLGLQRVNAFKFSFLLSIPAILGSFLFECKDIWDQQGGLLFDWKLVLAFSIALVVGYFSLFFLKQLIHKKKLHYFSYYLLIMGLVTLFLNYGY